MLTFTFVSGLILVVLSVGSLFYGIRTNKPGEPQIGSGGAGIFVILGFAFFAMGSLLFILGLLGRYSNTGIG